MNFLPVLIGSQALKQYNFNIPSNARDWDIIVNKRQKIEINSYKIKPRWSYSEKIDNMIKMKINNLNDEKIEIKVDLLDIDNDLYGFVYELCNTYRNDLNCKTIKVDVLGNLLIPPLEFLYAIKKGHIHRVLNYHNDNINNAKDWYRQVIMYNSMRKKLGYKRIDKIIYNNYFVKPLIKNNEESFNDFNTRRIFVKSFNNTNERVGDTKISLEKNEQEFFVDNIIRYIEHDELHKLVAQKCRNTETLMFQKYQNRNTVEMDKDLFLSDTQDNQSQTIKEEIIVLYLERKLIPTLVRMYRDKNISYKGFGKKHHNQNMMEIIAHFITNLCGHGHSWLRQWCIDHIHLFTMFNLYNYKNIDEIAISVSGVNISDTEPDKKLVSFIDFINKGHIIYTKTGSYRSRKPHRRLPHFVFKKTNRSIELGYGKSEVKLNCIKLCEYYDREYSFNLIYKHSQDSDIIKRVVRKFVSSKYVYYCDNCIYDPFNNIGIYDSAKNSYLFRISNIADYDTEYSINTMNLKGHSSKYLKSYEERRYSYYYYSSADCGMDNEVNFTEKYMSTYGNLPYSLARMFNILARIDLEIHEDHEQRKAGSKIRGNQVFGDIKY